MTIHKRSVKNFDTFEKSNRGLLEDCTHQTADIDSVLARKLVHFVALDLRHAVLPGSRLSREFGQERRDKR